jgi:GTP-binding protein YchF
LQAGSVDPARDAEIINLELALADLAQVDRRIERCARDKKTDPLEKPVLLKVREALDAGQPARTLLPSFSPEELVFVERLQLLTAKKMIYAANVADADMAEGNELVRKLEMVAQAEGAKVVIVSAQVESELIDLSAEERAEFLESLGVTLEECGLRRLVRAAYDLLGLRTYFTSGPTETRAWTIQAGWTAPQAAGVIHGDFERGFIRAETIGYDDLVKSGSERAAKDAGLLRSEGKEYLVKEGDVMLFRFNV